MGKKLETVEDYENKINEVASYLYELKENGEDKSDEYLKKYTKLGEICYEWITKKFNSSDYYEISYDGITKYFKYSEEAFNCLKDSIINYSPKTEEKFIKYYTSNLIKKLNYATASKEGEKYNKKYQKEIKYYEEKFNCPFESSQMKELCLSNELLTKKHYATLVAYKLSRNVSSLDTSVSSEDDSSSLKDFIEDDKDYSSIQRSKILELIDKICKCIEYSYTYARPNSKKLKSNAYSYCIFELLFQLPKHNVIELCSKYSFLNQQAILHFIDKKEVPTALEFATVTGSKNDNQRYKERIDSLIEFLKEDEELIRYKDFFETIYQRK